ncbi:MAG: hypothetical protein LBH43_01790 [Treponema sp.]|nr:hypothetical protein [Treponema sp.]
MKEIKNMLRTKVDVKDGIVDRIYTDAVSLFISKTKPLSFRHDDSLAVLIRKIRIIAGKTADVDKLVYVYSDEKNFIYLSTGIQDLKTLDKCDYYKRQINP